MIKPTTDISRKHRIRQTPEFKKLMARFEDEDPGWNEAQPDYEDLLKVHNKIREQLLAMLEDKKI